MPAETRVRRARDATSYAKRLVAASDYFLSVIGELTVDDLLAMVREGRSGDGGQDRVVGAVRLLAAKGDPRAVPEVVPLLTALRGDRAMLHDLAVAIGGFGHVALDPLLELWTSTETEGARDAVALALSRLGVRDPRILVILLDRLRLDAEYGATLLEQYGDAAAIPFLHRALGIVDVERGEPRGTSSMVLAVASAILDLGGRLSPSELFKANVALRVRGHAILAE